MPSIDKVGRHFPLTIALPINAEDDLLTAVMSMHAWYGAIEQVALSALDVDFSADDLEHGLAAHPLPARGRNNAGNPAGAQALADWWTTAAEEHKVVQLPSLDALSETLGSAANRLFASLGRGRTLWWTAAAPGGLAELCCFNGLPPESRFATLLHGPTMPPEPDRGFTPTAAVPTALSQP